MNVVLSDQKHMSDSGNKRFVLRSLCSMLVFFSFLIISTNFSIAYRQLLTTEQKLLDFAQLKQQFFEHYAMLEWKQQHLGIDWPQLFNDAEQRVRMSQSNEEFYNVFTDLAAQLQDPHVYFLRPYIDQYTLGFVTYPVGEQAIITAIDDTLDLPFQVGDVLIAINGETPFELAKTFVRFANHTHIDPEHSSRSKTYSFYHLTQRFSRLMPSPDLSQSIEVAVQSYSTGEVNNYKLAWHPTTQLLPIAGHFSAIPVAARATFQEVPVGSGGKIVFGSLDNRIGYLRIETFYESNWLQYVEAYKHAVAWLFNNTDVLILDLSNNQGGYEPYGLMMLSFFADQWIKPGTMSFRIDDRLIDDYQYVIKQLAGSELEEELDHVLQASQKISGNEDYPHTPFRPLGYPYLLAEIPEAFDWLYDIEYRHDVSYHKQLFVVVNEMCASFCEIFSAILQDNQRAKIIGSSTAGAGGFIYYPDFLEHSKGQMTLTRSIYKRLNGQFIENIGVIPDEEQVITVNDIHNANADWWGGILSIVRQYMSEIYPQT